MKYIKFAAYLAVIIGFSIIQAGSFDDFFRAIHSNDASAVANLLKRGFDANARDANGQTALCLAVLEGSDQVIDTLLKHPQIDVDAHNNAGETALMLAALKGRFELTSRLIARGAAITQEGWNALHYAATGPEPKIVAMLLQRGAPINARSPNGTTALMMAARYGTEQSVTLLLEQNANATLRNDRGMNAADFARSGGRESLAKRLESRLP